MNLFYYILYIKITLKTLSKPNLTPSRNLPFTKTFQLLIKTNPNKNLIQTKTLNRNLPLIETYPTQKKLTQTLTSSNR